MSKLQGRGGHPTHFAMAPGLDKDILFKVPYTEIDGKHVEWDDDALYVSVSKASLMRLLIPTECVGNASCACNKAIVQHNKSAAESAKVFEQAMEERMRQIGDELSD